MKRWPKALILLCAAALLFAPMQTRAAPTGISGSFELYFARQPAGSAEPAFTMTIPGTFAAADNDFVAEVNYPLPGGGTERARLLLLDNAQKLLLLYPETLNYQRIVVKGDVNRLLSAVPEIVGGYFNATPESLQEDGFKLSSQGRVVVGGEKLLAYTTLLSDGAEASVKGEAGEEWKLTLYFMPSTKHLRLLQVKSANSVVRLKLQNVKKGKVNPDRFKVPSGYYETEPLTISSGGHG
jgi:hypothetical protein